MVFSSIGMCAPSAVTSSAVEISNKYGMGFTYAWRMVSRVFEDVAYAAQENET